jgi:hypothetical protein
VARQRATTGQTRQRDGGSSGSPPSAVQDKAGAVGGVSSSRKSGASANTEEAKKRKAVVDGVVGAAKGVAKKAGTLRANAGEKVDDPVLAIVGLLTVASASLGAFVLYRLSRRHALR